MQPVVPEHVAEAERVLANCLAAQRRYAEAEPLLRRSVEALRAHIGEEVPATQKAIADLEALYRARGKRASGRR
jgi:hypothetical protein